MSEWIMRLAYINLLWIVFTLLGGIVLGIMPATVSLFTITRKWVMGDDDCEVFKLFWETYKKNFMKASLLGYVLVVAGFVLFLYYQGLQILPEQLSQVLQVFFYSILLILGVVVAFIFPVFVHFKVNFGHYYKNALIIGLSFPHFAALMLFVLVVFFVVYQFFPVLALFFGVSVPGYLLMAISFIVFKKIELKQNKNNQEYNDNSGQLSV
ncbi:YesL family protein [Fredinandcohnia sp. QZ13]|uniref:YesL family protein n=1 Tax=Fredinandcohnia sp. QZ13 TaxID=3073144 RepID=UPI0028532044|nr:YesL family protein [Fredinandcohnia sp. QZ13]MDR4888111.1 YesL family protein [Fredinandcohnia sp. QZ13]